MNQLEKFRGYVICLAVAFFIIFAPGLGAENIRGELAGIAPPGGTSLVFRPEQVVAIDLAEDQPFLAGMEIEITLPAGLRQYPNSFALLVYKAISPNPMEGTHTYLGERSYMRLIPNRETMFVRIPLKDDINLTGDALTDVLPTALESEDFPLLVTVLPLGKGVPDAAFLQEIGISSKPILENRGSIAVRIANPLNDDTETVKILIDGREIGGAGEPVVVEAGLHRLRVESTHAPSEERTIAVEPGSQIIVDWELDYTPSELMIKIPRGVSVLLDGEILETNDDVLVLNPDSGIHIITYRIGDIEVSREFQLSPGGKISIDLLVDISIVGYGDAAPGSLGQGDGSL